MSNAAYENSGSGQNNSNNTQSSKPIDLAKIAERVKAVITKPEATWPVIKAENLTIAQLYKDYFLLIAAIPVVASWLGMAIIGIDLPFVGRIRTPFISGFFSACLYYAASLVMLYVGAIIMEKLAPKFEGVANITNTFKLVAFASIPASIAGIFSLIPALSFLGMLGGIYSAYVLYKAIPLMTGVPEKSRLVYFLSCIGCGFVAGVLLMLVVGLINAVLFASSQRAESDAMQRNVEKFIENPDLNKLEQVLKETQKYLPQQN